MKLSQMLVGLALLLVLAACGKAPVPATESEEAAHQATTEGARVVAITPEAAREAGIETGEVGPAHVRELLPLYGVIQPNAERMRAVSARFAGVVKTVTARIGDAVRAGDVLATVESNDSLQTYAVTAPIDGIVTTRDVNPGETVAEKPLFTVADLSTVWVQLSLFPNDRARVKVGQYVRVRAASGPSIDTGRIVWVSMVGAAENQSVIARALLDNHTHQWTPGLYVSGEVIVSESSVPLAVHVTAIQNVEEQPVVFVRTARGFELRPVRLGRRDSEMVEVLEGLRAGEPYVTVGSFLVKAEFGKAGAKDED